MNGWKMTKALTTETFHALMIYDDSEIYSYSLDKVVANTFKKVFHGVEKQIMEQDHLILQMWKQS